MFFPPRQKLCKVASQMFAAKLGDKTKQWYWHVLNCHLAKMLSVVDLWSLGASTGEARQKQ